jgi:hypothetical protein
MTLPHICSFLFPSRPCLAFLVEKMSRAHPYPTSASHSSSLST